MKTRIDFAGELIKLHKVREICSRHNWDSYSDVREAAELVFELEIIPAAKRYIASVKGETEQEAAALLKVQRYCKKR